MCVCVHIVMCVCVHIVMCVCVHIVMFFCAHLLSYHRSLPRQRECFVTLIRACPEICGQEECTTCDSLVQNLTRIGSDSSWKIFWFAFIVIVVTVINSKNFRSSQFLTTKERHTKGKVDVRQSCASSKLLRTCCSLPQVFMQLKCTPDQLGHYGEGNCEAVESQEIFTASLTLGRTSSQDNAQLSSDDGDDDDRARAY